MSLPPAYSATDAPNRNPLSDSIYELYNPGVGALLDVVFFHGLQSSHTSEAHLSTWRSRGSQKEVWPMTWLPEEFPGARILSVKYDACITRSAKHGRLDLYCTAESLMTELILAKVGQHPRRPVILVGHSYGGLVIKQLCLHAHFSESLNRSQEQMAGFLNCVRGIFFYGTPHHGMSSFLSPNGTHLKHASPLLDYVKLLCSESARLHQTFDALRRSYKWSIAGVGESHPTTIPITASVRLICVELPCAVAVSSEMIVDEASARYGDFTVEHGDHVSLCEPESRTSNTYKRLTTFIQNIDGNQVNWRRLLDDFQTVPKMAMSLHSHLFVKRNYKEIERGVYSSMHHHGKQVAGSGWKPTALSHKTLLLVLDDIDNDSHLELFQYISSVNDCANSRYIVTSRDRDIVNRSDAWVFDVELLNHKSSKELFMNYAFSYSIEPSPSLTEWIDKIVAKCDGLPLTLEVMGKYLRRKVSENIWKQCLDALDEADNIVGLDERLWAKLRVSYDRLGSDEKKVFLDAASFFNNSTWNLREAKSCWRFLYGLEDLRWQTLVDMSLVYDIGEEEKIQMHEQLRSLGCSLASGRGTSGRCRTWTKKNVPSRFNSSNYDERIAEVQFYSNDLSPRSSSTGMETHIQEVMALRLEDSMPLNWRNICQMKKLQYLDSEKELTLDAEGGKLPKNVVLLRWRGEVYNLHDLVDRGYAGHLAVLDLEAPLTCLPKTVSEFRNLEVLKFQGGLFQDLPETFVCLDRLRHLTFSNCGRLRSLPKSFGRLSDLRSLELRFCRNFEGLPDSIGKLSSLQTLIIEGKNKLQRLPESFRDLFRLQRLIISRSKCILKLPKYFRRLTVERDMHLDNMPMAPKVSVEESNQALLGSSRQILTANTRGGFLIMQDIQDFPEDESDLHNISRHPSCRVAWERIVRANRVKEFKLLVSSWRRPRAWWRRVEGCDRQLELCFGPILVIVTEHKEGSPRYEQAKTLLRHRADYVPEMHRNISILWTLIDKGERK